MASLFDSCIAPLCESEANSCAVVRINAQAVKVVGSTDKHAAEVKDTPISPKDILATAFHLLGIDPETTVLDQLGRLMPIAGEGRARAELLG